MEENLQGEQEPQDLFDNHFQYTEASQGSRFLNFLIDNLFMRFALSYATGYAFGYLLLAIAPDFLMELAYNERGWQYYLSALLLGYFNYIIYYTICEAAFKGYTLGKLITGTKAIRDTGEPLTFKDALLRSLSRIVPFEVFSGLGHRPWHDTWTKTTVVKSR
jgi:uncharacterized RDD family membrane protein YckC